MVKQTNKFNHLQYFFIYLQSHSLMFQNQNNNLERKVTLDSNVNQISLNKNQTRKESANLIKKYPQLPNKKDINLWFQESQLYVLGHQLPSYLTLIKLIIFLMILLIIAFALPLSILLINGNSISSQSLLIRLSIFNIVSNGNLDLLAYFSIPLYCIHFLIIILLSFRLAKIKQDIVEKNMFPTDYALFIKLPAAHLKEEEICDRIEGWFKKQMKNNKQLLLQFPQLLKEQAEVGQQQCESIFSNNVKKVNSSIIESVLLSFSYEDYLKLVQEVNRLTICIQEQNTTNLKPEQINALVEVYNKKKNILNVLPTNEYCLVLFKKIQYAQYFYQKNQGSSFTSFFCPQSYSHLEIKQERIQVFNEIFPNQIKWQQLHYDDSFKIKKKLVTIAVFTTFILLGLGSQFASIYLGYNNFIPHSSIFALIVNIIIVVFNRILRFFIQNQPSASYTSTQKYFVFCATISNILILSIIPLIISLLINPQIIYSSEGYISYQIYSVLFYAIFTIGNIYICSSSTDQKSLQISNSYKQEKLEKTSINEHKIQYLLTSYLTILSISYFLAPFFPLILAISLVWFLLMYGLEKYNIIRLYDQLQYHGGKLIYQISNYFKKAILFFMLGLIFVFSFASFKFNYSWSVSTAVIISFLFIVSIVFEFISVDKTFYFCSKEKQAELLDKGKITYSKAKENFVLLYESFNFALSYNLKQNGRPNNYSTRIKIYQQLNTMSKTLCLSLKQKLFKNGQAILQNQRKQTFHEQDNDVYYQYQKKIHMQISKPKISIPPLFKKQESIHIQGQDDVEMKNFNSIFSSDDRQGRRVFKKHILNKLNQKAVQK